MWRKVIPIHCISPADYRYDFTAGLCSQRGKMRNLHMNCLVIAATAKEIAPFLDHYRNKPAGIALDTDVLISGVGLTATTYSLGRQLGLKKPDLVIQAGIAGCFDKKIPLGTVVAIKQDTIADEGVVESGRLRTLSDLGLVSPDQFPYKKGWLVNPGKKMMKASGLKTVKAVSVNQVSTDPHMIGQYEQVFGADIETMEGAALHYVCLMEKIPFLQVRSISNYVGERNKTRWDMKAAIHNLNKTLIKLLESL